MHKNKRVLLVTGASSGIGRAIAVKLLQQGHTVIGTARNCGKFTTEHPCFSSFQLDLAQPDQLASQLKSLEKLNPELDGIIFSAGYGQFGGLEQFSFAQIQQLITVNFTSQALITRALIPSLKRKSHSNLIYIGSEAALKGSRKGSIYCASKFALRGFTQALRDECGTSSVRVSLVNPGMVNTEFFESLSFQPGQAKGNALSADDIAEAVSYILAAKPHLVIDEINLNPANKVIQFKK